MKYPNVVIVGRTNAGKSTLFNRLIEKKQAIVSPIPGTTRDRNIAVCSWSGYNFTLIDTGGMDVSYSPKKKLAKNLIKKTSAMREIEKKIIEQAQIAIKTADLILFLIDAQVGALPSDRSIVNLLRKQNKPFLFVANKVDNKAIRERLEDLQSLGLGMPIPISSASGVGCGDLLDEIVKLIPAIFDEEEKPDINIAILGKPNVGKSSLLNALCGNNRVIVTDIPHTTRESHDAVIIHKNKKLRIIDTAGIRRKARVEGSLEKEGINKSFLSLKQADIVLFIFEVNTPFSDQDSQILHEILKTNASIILVANKWDLITEKTTRTHNQYQENLQSDFPFLKWAPLLFISAKTGEKTKKVLDLILQVYEYRFLKLSDEVLESFIMETARKHAPKKGIKRPKIVAMKQFQVNPPRFNLFVHDRKCVHPSYIRYVQNQLYEKFKFSGSPLKIEMRGLKK